LRPILRFRLSEAVDEPMQISTGGRPYDAVRRVRATVGVTGAVLTLSVAAAVPALANGHSSGSHGASSGHSQSPSHASKASDGHGASATHANSASNNSASSSSTSSDSTGHNPPGNNGTVFIHDVAGDDSPHNVPHVSCTFYVDFFGFDAGQTVTVSFAGQAPTGMGTALGGTWTGVVSDDDASGAGNDFDKELAFTADQLGVSSLGTPAKQGYHVKMTVATNEPGGKKSKVFWIEPCAPAVSGAGASTGGTTGGGTTGGELTGGGVVAGTTATSTGSTTTAAVLGTSVGSAGATIGGATMGGATAGGTTAGAGAGVASVLGESFTRSASNGAVAGRGTGLAGLPFTGAEIGLMAAAGLGAVGAGAGFVVASRRRKRARAIA
jgi:hypothetical protein